MSRRLFHLVSGKPLTIQTAENAAEIFWPLLRGLDHEALAVMALNRRHKVLNVEILTSGNDAFTIVCPRQIFRWALKQGRSGASAVILAHNHPSEDPEPSPQDLKITKVVAAAGKVVGIKVLDHLVMTDAEFRSIAALGLLPTWAKKPF